ncbi:MAG: TAXI family TRAP transporter solute-binding subunit [Desulfatitalea sp.]|nr:TAXI family TRAP transporter solute-binding subunit [Desulfatitalea sp.]
MRKTSSLLCALIALVFVVTLFWLPPMGEAQRRARLAFSGGPDGGTFQYFSNAIASRLSKNLPNIDLSNMASAGSVENLRRVNSGDADFGIVYAGDLYLALNGKLTGDTRIYANNYSMAYLYGAPAQLLVLEGSGIKSVQELAGKRVAVGPAGSGAAASAQRYFTSVGLWDKFTPEYIGYSQGASALGDKLIDAMWVFAGFPNASVIQAAASNRIRLLDLVAYGKEKGFFDDYPFYTEVTIPAGTYQGVDYDVLSIQDAAIWTAGKHVSDEIVYGALNDIYSEEGLKYMYSITTAAKAMTMEDGLMGIATPVHPAAAKFWQEKGLTLTDMQKLP